MDPRQIDLVKLENYARQNPREYKFRVGLLALLGYGYIFAILSVLAAIIGFLIFLIVVTHRANYAVLKLLFIFSIPTFLILRSVWDVFTFKIPPPSGLELSPNEVPELFKTVEGLRTSLQCPPFQHIYLTDDYNAAVLQVPRLGFFGWTENYLIIGLPLLQSLSLEQFKAVIAHELGHLSGNHGRFKGYIYRLRQMWALLLERMSRDRQGGGSVWLLERFFNWYIPFFNAYSFILARSDEYEADRSAVKLTDRDTFASALIGVNVKSRWIDEQFWSPVYQRVNFSPDPPERPFHELGQHLKTDISDDRALEWLEECLRVETNYSDTHPCLRDRLRAIGWEYSPAPTFFIPLTETAAEAVLGSAVPSLTERLNQRWRENINFRWKEQHEQEVKNRERLEVLDNQALYRELLIEEAWERANLTARVKGYEEAIPLLSSLLRRSPDHVYGNILLGDLLLSRKDESGIGYLERAMGSDLNVVINCCYTIADFWQDRGNSEKAASYRQRAVEHFNAIQRAEGERRGVSARDKFKPHDLSGDRLRAFQESLSRYGEIRSAYLVCKVVNTFPEIPFYILGICSHQRGWGWSAGQQDEKLVNHLAETLSCPGQTWIVILNNSNRGLTRALRKVDNSLIYS